MFRNPLRNIDQAGMRIGALQFAGSAQASDQNRSTSPVACPWAEARFVRHLFAFAGSHPLAALGIMRGLLQTGACRTADDKQDH